MTGGDWLAVIILGYIAVSILAAYLISAFIRPEDACLAFAWPLYIFWPVMWAFDWAARAGQRLYEKRNPGK